MISVVIPLYNKEKSVLATLESVLAQTYTDYEIIVINDGSTDNSTAVVEQIIASLNEAKQSTFRFLSQPNSGVSSARNLGIKAANGEYVAFLDADDLWTPDYLETLATLIRDYPNAGLYSLGYKENHSDSIPEKVQRNENTFRGSVEQPWLMRKRVWTGSVAAAKDQLIMLGLFDTRMTHGEDIDMWWRLILNGGLVVDSTCCAYYRQDTENRAMDKVIPLEKHIPYYIDKYSKARAANAEFRKYFDEQMVYRLYPYMFTKQYKKEARRLAKELDYSQMKWTMHFRMLFPYLYRIYQKLAGK